MASNYSTILVDNTINQLRYVAPIHQFQNWGPNQNPNISLCNMISQTSAYNVMTIINQNIGIGTTNPLSKVHIIGSASRGTTSSNTLIIDGNNSLVGINIVSSNSASSTNSACNINGLYLFHDISCNAVIQNITGNIFIRNGTSTPAIFIDKSNNVGIGGTTTPNMFSIMGGGASIGYSTSAQTNSLIISNTLSVGTTSYTNTLNVQGNTGINGNIAIGTYSALTPTTTNSLIISGNVGIGNSNPTNNSLNVGGSVAIGNYGINNYAAPTNGLIVSGNVGIGTSTTNGLLSIYGGNASIMSGYLGIGITNPKNSIDIAGNVAIGNISNGSSAPTNGLLVLGNVVIGNFNRLGTNNLSIAGNISVGFSTSATTANAPANGLLVFGNSGIGTATPPTNTLEIYGSMAIGANYYGLQSTLPSSTSLIITSNVGIGISSPAYTLHVAGTTTVNNLNVGGDLSVSGYTNITNSTVTETNTFSISNATPNTPTTPGLKVLQYTGSGTLNGAVSGNPGYIADFYDSSTSLSIPVLRIGKNNTVVIGDGVSTNVAPAVPVPVPNPTPSLYNLLVNGVITASSLVVGTGGITSAGGTGIISASSVTGGILASSVLPTLLNQSGTNTNPVPLITSGQYANAIANIGTPLNASASNGSYPILTVDQYGRIINTTTQSIISSQWSGPGSSAIPFISFTGCVGIGTSGSLAAGTYNQQGASTTFLNVDGDIYASGDVMALSDKKYKTNLEIIPNSIEKIKKINGYTYTRTDTLQRQTGVIAQELEKVLPEAVQTNADGNKSVAYGNVIGLLIECIKTQQNQIEDLQATLNSLIK